MGRKIVYVIDDMGDAPESNLEFIDAEDLSDLESEGLKILTSKKKTIKGVECEKVELTDEKELAVVDNEPPSRALVQSIAEAITGALAVTGGSSHLGGASNTQMISGMPVRSGNFMAAPFDEGVTAYYKGKSEQDNPWPVGTDEGTQWLNGFLQATSTSCAEDPVEQELKASEAEGYRTAKAAKKREKSGKVVEVGCSYRGKKLKAWQKGFERGGGTLEG